jgi:hypothetical protein
MKAISLIISSSASAVLHSLAWTTEGVVVRDIAMILL